MRSPALVLFFCRPGRAQRDPGPRGRTTDRDANHIALRCSLRWVHASRVYPTCVVYLPISGKPEIAAPSSRIKLALAKVLKDEGYIEDFAVDGDAKKPTVKVRLKYYQGRPVIERLERVSRPGLRVYRAKDDLPKVLGGMGVAIISTSRGLMTDREARAAGHGGEVLCIVS